MTRIEDYTHEFIHGAEQLNEADMRAAMKRGELTEVEQRIVLREVRAARESVAEFGTAPYVFSGDVA